MYLDVVCGSIEGIYKDSSGNLQVKMNNVTNMSSTHVLDLIKSSYINCDELLDTVATSDIIDYLEDRDYYVSDIDPYNEDDD